MSEQFKVKDTVLLDAIFYIFDIEGKGTIDIRSICANILLHMNCDVIIKMHLLFEILMEEGKLIHKPFLIKNKFVEKSKIIDVI